LKGAQSPFLLRSLANWQSLFKVDLKDESWGLCPEASDELWDEGGWKVGGHGRKSPSSAGSSEILAADLQLNPEDIRAALAYWHIISVHLKCAQKEEVLPCPI
jgi:hypothetical protein